MAYQDVITIAAGGVSTGLIAGTEASGADAGKIVIEEGGTLVAGTIREGGALSAVYGAVASNLTAETGAVVEISDGAQTSGLLLAGENTNIAEGRLYYRGTAITGNAVNGILANLNGTYRICIGDGITAADPVLGNSVRIYAQSGSIVSGGNISTNGNIGLLGNASGNGVTVGGEGVTAATYNLFDTATADNTTVDKGGTLAVRAGNIARTVTVNSGGMLTVSEGGVASNVIANPGALFTLAGGSIIGGIFTGNKDHATAPQALTGAFIKGVTLTTDVGYSTPQNCSWLRIGFGVGNRASAADITVERGAKFQINNGYAENTVAITNGGIFVYGYTTDQSLAHHTIVGDGGSAYVFNRAGYNTGSMTDTWIQSGGTGIVGNDAGAGGTMLDTVVNSGGKLTVSSNGVATVDEHPWLTKTNVTVKSGAEVTYGRFHNIYYGINDGKTGSVTICGAVSPAGGNFEEPVTQATLKVVGAFLGLSRDRANARRYPSIHPLESWSKYRSLVPAEEVAEARAMLRKGNEVNQMMMVVGEEGTPIEDFVVYLKGEFLDAVYLQQNTFDPIDSACSSERQRYVFAKVLAVLRHSFDFEDKTAARDFFNQLRQAFIDWNYAPWQGEGFAEGEKNVDNLLNSK